MFPKRRKGRSYIHMYLYNSYYYIIFIWGLTCIFLITSGLCESQQQQQIYGDNNSLASLGGSSNTKRKEIKQAITTNLLKLFNLKEVPKVPKNKAHVPIEMLREYMKYRSLVRNTIPNDRDFFGKINLDDIDNVDEYGPGFWSEVVNKYDRTIEIDMSVNKDNSARHNVKRAHQHDKPPFDQDMDGAQSDAPNLSIDSAVCHQTSSSSSSSSSGSIASNCQSNAKPNNQSTNNNNNNQKLTPTRRENNNGRTTTTTTNQKSSNRNRPTTAPPRPNDSKSTATGRTTSNTKCHIETFTLQFEDVGWSNWIIAPASYQANFCSGDCSFPLADYQNSTNHAIIQAIFHSVGRQVPRTCCAPTKLGKMAILYQLDRSVQMKYYDDMIVESCGCL